MLQPLTNLRALAISIWDESADSRAALDAALRALPQLTALFLQLVQPLPPALTGLVPLQHFAAWCWHSRNAAPPHVLPSGPWLAGLRKVALLGDVAIGSTEVLQAAAQLEFLALGIRGFAPLGEAARLLQFAGQHPTLQWVWLSGGWGVGNAQAAAVAAGNPRVSISFVERWADLIAAAVSDLAADFYYVRHLDIA